MSSVNLCALHCKTQNTEQILGSLGLYAYIREFEREAGRIGAKIDEEEIRQNQGQ